MQYINNLKWTLGRIYENTKYEHMKIDKTKVCTVLISQQLISRCFGDTVLVIVTCKIQNNYLNLAPYFSNITFYLFCVTRVSVMRMIHYVFKNLFGNTLLLLKIRNLMLHNYTFDISHFFFEIENATFHRLHLNVFLHILVHV